jgi:hypothetical protein
MSATLRSSREGIATTDPMTTAQKRKALNPRGIDYNHGLPAGQLSQSFKAGRREFTSATVYVQQRDDAVLEGAGCGGDFHPCGGMRIGPCRFGSLSLLPRKIAGSSPVDSASRFQHPLSTLVRGHCLHGCGGLIGTLKHNCCTPKPKTDMLQLDGTIHHSCRAAKGDGRGLQQAAFCDGAVWIFENHSRSRREHLCSADR